MRMLFSFCEMHKRNSDQLLNIFSDNRREGKACQKYLVILQNLFQNLQRYREITFVGSKMKVNMEK
jgi:hypothetical protein